MADVASTEALKRLLEQRTDAFLEVWASRGDRNLAALINGDVGFVTLFPFETDEGVWTRNEACMTDECLPFRLEGGQLDHHPKSFCVPVDAIIDAFEHFFRTGDPDPALTWGNSH